MDSGASAVTDRKLKHLHDRLAYLRAKQGVTLQALL
jgi:hypothetical protein